MSLPVHLVPSLKGVEVGATVALEGNEAHHAVAVRRLRAGESLLLTDGLGARVVGTVQAIGKRRLEVGVLEITRSLRPQPELVVVQALPKGDRGELAVEVLTEVGVGRIVPWAAERSVTVWRSERAEKSLAKWRATAREAAKQARRVWHPEVSALANTAEVADLLAEADLGVVLHEEAELPLASLHPPAHGTVVVVVGPEGGLTPEEVALFTAAGAHGVRLGAEVLRTSTAGVVAAGVLLSRTDRWSPTGPGLTSS